MSRTPALEHRDVTPYLAIPAVVTMASMAETLPPLTPRLFGYLAEHQLAPSGPPFWKYDVIDMARSLRVEVGVPIGETSVAPGVESSDEITVGVLPAGTYVTTIHVGHPDQLMEATTALLGWAEQNGIAWDSEQASDGDHWACRLEEYLTDPAIEPDLTKWQTRLSFKTAD